MAYLISFSTDRFDVSGEKPNAINPIAGETVLLWLREGLLKAQYRVQRILCAVWFSCLFVLALRLRRWAVWQAMKKGEMT